MLWLLVLFHVKSEFVHCPCHRHHHYRQFIRCIYGNCRSTRYMFAATRVILSFFAVVGIKCPLVFNHFCLGF
jgi:hypothetical protein